jgi:uncharacterized membrane protein
MISLSVLLLVLSTVSLIVSIVTMVFVIVLMNKFQQQSRREGGRLSGTGQDASARESAKSSPETGVVFCRTCGNQYDSNLKVCPNCKTPR